MSRDAFGYFNEYISYSWESRMGNQRISDAWSYTYSKHGADNIPALFRYPQNAINQVKQNLGPLINAYTKFYNNLKK
ncbi:hypothetical protein [Chryseobacterium sp. ERMR1:04]|uniref:hypothetical protein n=1 Tax=Chryseobacterium sp. ERMR1:04 TaxID=1705393 RepID=UPI0006C88B98|nr:hypothetical protein [Chryseobacterium sp. ERMR1:04]KPH13818.1 hypothetical protein AMQ68_09795 [Chryseobacterium sp. ERMR1:04]